MCSSSLKDHFSDRLLAALDGDDHAQDAEDREDGEHSAGETGRVM